MSTIFEGLGKPNQRDIDYLLAKQKSLAKRDKARKDQQLETVFFNVLPQTIARLLINLEYSKEFTLTPTFSGDNFNKKTFVAYMSLFKAIFIFLDVKQEDSHIVTHAKADTPPEFNPYLIKLNSEGSDNYSLSQITYAEQVIQSFKINPEELRIDILEASIEISKEKLASTNSKISQNPWDFSVSPVKIEKELVLIPDYLGILESKLSIFPNITLHVRKALKKKAAALVMEDSEDSYNESYIISDLQLENGIKLTKKGPSKEEVKEQKEKKAKRLKHFLFKCSVALTLLYAGLIFISVN